MIGTQKPICRHPLENTVTVTLSLLLRREKTKFLREENLGERSRGFLELLPDLGLLSQGVLELLPADTRAHQCMKRNMMKARAGYLSATLLSRPKKQTLVIISPGRKAHLPNYVIIQVFDFRVLLSDLKNEKTTKQEFHQEHYCFLVERFYLGQ